jgi:hypothetical protein
LQFTKVLVAALAHLNFGNTNFNFYIKLFLILKFYYLSVDAIQIARNQVNCVWRFRETIMIASKYVEILSIVIILVFLFPPLLLNFANLLTHKSSIATYHGILLQIGTLIFRVEVFLQAWFHRIIIYHQFIVLQINK